MIDQTLISAEITIVIVILSFLHGWLLLGLIANVLKTIFAVGEYYVTRRQNIIYRI